MLFGVWLVWSGHFEPLLIGLGLFSCVLVVLIGLRLGVIDDESVPYHVTLPAMMYAPWLLWQIAKSNVDVARRILHPRLPIHPGLVRVKPGQRTDLGRVVYANSITLTPGTVSIDMSADEILVHALTRESAAELASGEMDARVSRLEEAR